MGSAELICPRYTPTNDFTSILKYHTRSDVTRDKKKSALLIAYQDNNAKLSTDEKIREVKTIRNDTYIGTWNIRTLREGKIK